MRKIVNYDDIKAILYNINTPYMIKKELLSLFY